MSTRARVQRRFSCRVPPSVRTVPVDSQPVPAGRRVSKTAAALLVLAVLFQLTIGHTNGDSASYGAGYAAASNGPLVRAVLNGSGGSSSRLCDELVDRVVVKAESGTVVRADFISGCKHAIGDAME